MASFASWCQKVDQAISKHQLCALYADPGKLKIGIAALAKIVPTHYAAEERIARLLKRLGKAKAAEFILLKLPTSKSIRSGDLGEILASNFVSEFTKFGVAINRLRWKDHRNMAMRGDDVIAVRKGVVRKVEFLKGEVKSAVSLTSSTISKARAALRTHNNRPSPHALSFLADRLHQQGDHLLGDLIDAAQLDTGIKLDQVTHLLFTFSGNDSKELLEQDLTNYKGRVTQLSVGVVVKKVHQSFIRKVYETVKADG